MKLFLRSPVFITFYGSPVRISFGRFSPFWLYRRLIFRRSRRVFGSPAPLLECTKNHR